MKKISAICDRMDKFYKFFFYLTGALLGAILIISCFVVFGRLFGVSPIWSDELQRFLMVAMVFAAIPYMACNKTFLVVDLTAIFFSKHKKFHDTMLLIGEILFLALLVYLFFPCLELTVKNANTYSSALRLPMGYMYALMPASFGLAALGMIKNLVKHFFVDRPAAKSGEVQ